MTIQVHGLRAHDTLRSLRAGAGVMRPGSSRYLRGTGPGEEPVTIHAAELRGQDEYIGLCDGRAVVPLLGRFGLGDPAACPQSRRSRPDSGTGSDRDARLGLNVSRERRSRHDPEAGERHAHLAGLATRQRGYLALRRNRTGSGWLAAGL